MSQIMSNAKHLNGDGLGLKGLENFGVRGLKSFGLPKS